MTKLLVPLTFASIIAAASAAYADVSSGHITVLNSATARVTLDDGNTYDFSLAANKGTLRSFKKGDWVTVSYTTVGTGHEGTTISPAVHRENSVRTNATIDTGTGTARVTAEKHRVADFRPVKTLAARIGDFTAGD